MSNDAETEAANKLVDGLLVASQTKEWRPMSPTKEALAAARKLFSVIPDPNHSKNFDVELCGCPIGWEPSRADADELVSDLGERIATAMDAFVIEARPDYEHHGLRLAQCSAERGDLRAQLAACQAERDEARQEVERVTHFVGGHAESVANARRETFEATVKHVVGMLLTDAGIWRKSHGHTANVLEQHAAGANCLSLADISTPATTTGETE